MFQYFLISRLLFQNQPMRRPICIRPFENVRNISNIYGATTALLLQSFITRG